MKVLRASGEKLHFSVFSADWLLLTALNWRQKEENIEVIYQEVYQAYANIIIFLIQQENRCQ